MSSYLYAPIGFIFTVYDWLAVYIYKKRQPPKITYIRCFKCHSEDVLNKGGSPHDIKSKYCHKCYQELLHDAMQSILSGFN